MVEFGKISSATDGATATALLFYDKIPLLLPPLLLPLLLLPQLLLLLLKMRMKVLRSDNSVIIIIILITIIIIYYNGIDLDTALLQTKLKGAPEWLIVTARP